MKVALCLSGQPRFIEYGYKSIYKNLIEPNNPDIFVHTWFDNNDANKKFRDDGNWNNNSNNKIDPFTEQKILSLYKPVRYVCEPQRKFKNSQWEMEKTIEKYLSHLNKDYVVDMMHCMWYSIYQSNLIKETYKLEHDIHYDYVIRCRFDSIIPRMLICKELDPNFLWLSHDRNTPNQLDDWFAVSSNDTMNLYSDGFNLINFLYKTSMMRDGLFCNENLMYELVKKFNIPHKILSDFHIQFIRPWMI